VVATIVMDVTGTCPDFICTPTNAPGKGLTSIRIQRSGSSSAALFTSNVVFGVSCKDVVGDTDGRFVGNMNGWVPSSVLTSLFGGSFQNKAVIVDTDYPSCTDVFGGAGGGTKREVLSFTAVIQFEK